MSRKHREQAERAALAASEAARTLQARGQELRNGDKIEPNNPESSHGEPNKPNESSIRANPSQPRPEPRNEPRRLAMEEILARDRQTKGITEESEETPSGVASETPEAVQLPAPTPEPIPSEETEKGDVAPEAPILQTVKTVRVKVDGEEFDAPQEEVDAAGGVKAYQIEKAAENRLRKANEALTQTRQVQAQIAEWVKSQVPQQPTLTDDQFIASKVDTIRFGTPEESAAALREIMQRTQQNVDPNQIIERAVDKIKHDSAVTKFDSEFTDIVTNPLLLKLTLALRQERLQQVQQAYQNGQIQGPLDWNKFYSNIGNEVRSVLGRPSQPAAVSVTPGTPGAVPSGNPSQPDKEARKASIVNLPNTATTRAALPEAPKSETREETLNKMRQARGIPTG